MQDKAELIRSIIQSGAFLFGDFTLKSGLKSGYFINTGNLSEGGVLSQIGAAFADTIHEVGIEYDLLFGAAYKGIPLVTATSIAQHQRNLSPSPFAYNRKEVKTHGEKTSIIGSHLKGKKVILLDDILTVGTAIFEAKNVIEKSGGELVCAIVLINRQQINQTTNRFYVDEIQQQLPLFSILNLQHIIQVATQESLLSQEQLESLPHFEEH